MQEYKRIDIKSSEVLPTARRMREAGNYLVMIHAFINKEGLPDVSYDYAVDPAIESYHVVGEWKLPSIGDVYETAATWPERELNELMGLEFEGLDMSERLFLPEDMLETQGRGQILVTQLKELVGNMAKEEKA